LCHFSSSFLLNTGIFAVFLILVAGVSPIGDKGIYRLPDSVTELILGRGGLGEESNYDYSKLKRKGKERESNASYFTINTSVCVR
jgi:hypothetical protein